MSLELQNFVTGFRDYAWGVRGILTRKMIRLSYEDLKLISSMVKENMQKEADRCGISAIVNESLTDESDVEYKIEDDPLPVTNQILQTYFKKYDRVMKKYYPKLGLKQRRGYAKMMCNSLQVPSNLRANWIP